MKSPRLQPREEGLPGPPISRTVPRRRSWQALLDLTAMAGQNLPREQFLPRFVELLWQFGGSAVLGVFTRVEPENLQVHFTDDTVRRLGVGLSRELEREIEEAIETRIVRPAAHRTAPCIEFPVELKGMSAQRVRCHVLEADFLQGSRELVSLPVLGGVLSVSDEGAVHDLRAEMELAQVSGLLRLYLCRLSSGVALATHHGCLELLEQIFHGTLSGSGDVSPALDRLQAIFGHDMATLVLSGQEEWRVVHQAAPGVSPRFVQEAHLATLEAMRRELGSDSSPIVTESLPSRCSSSGGAEAVESFLILPLRFGKELPPGLLGLFSGRSDLFSADQIRLLSLLSPGLSLSVRNSNLLSRLTSENRCMTAAIEETDRQMELARQVQAHLIPRAAPDVPGLDVGCLYRPVASVGGDLFDFQSRADGTLAVFMADVSGKGVSAALLSSLTRGFLRSIRGDRSSPGTVMARLNGLLSEELSSDRFVTAVHARFDPVRGRLTLCSAGHEPVLHYSAARRSVQELSVQGPPLGILPEVKFSSSRRRCGPGDVLLLYTDGLLPRGGLDGRDWLADQLVSLASSDRDAAELASELHRRAESRIGRLHDDMAAVVVKLQ